MERPEILKDKSLIPHGDYCYIWIETPSEENGFRGKTKTCPYWKTKHIDGVEIAWCDFLNLGGTPGTGDWDGWKDENAYDKLIKHFGSEEELEKQTPLTLLFDMCKECGINGYEEDNLNDKT